VFLDVRIVQRPVFSEQCTCSYRFVVLSAGLSFNLSIAKDRLVCFD